MGGKTSGISGITYLLDTRLLTNGQIALVLHLFRQESRVLSVTLTTCDRVFVPSTLRTCRTHLGTLGLLEQAEPSTAMSPRRGQYRLGLPQAASL